MQPPYVCRMSTTPPAWYLPPPDTLSGNYPELVFHPRMNSRSEHDTSYCVRAPTSMPLPCNSSICIVCFIFTVPPLSLPRCYRRLHRCRVRLRRRRPYPYRRASRQAEPFPSPTYRLLFYIYPLH